MPKISRFHNIVIEMFARDHNPPHFHARYAKRNSLLALDGTLLEGSLPAREQRLVSEWASLHAAELQANWNLCMKGEKPNPIPGLP